MYPTLNGATGMTYETDGGGFKGLRWTRDDGTIATLRSAIAKHFIASMTTLETDGKKQGRAAERLITIFVQRRMAICGWKTETHRHPAAKGSGESRRAGRDTSPLKDRGQVPPTSPFYISTRHIATVRRIAPATPHTFPAGSYIIDLNQPQRILVKAILEPDTPQDKAFVDDNMARFRRNQMRGSGQSKEDYGFYDITAWSLPLAFGLDAYWTEDSGQYQLDARHR